MAENVYNEPDQFKPKKLFHVRIVRLGLAHMAIGFATLAAGIMDVSFSSIAFDIFSLGKSVTGIWVGVVVLLTGCVGLVSSRSELRRRTANNAFLILSALSLLLSMILIGIAISEIASSEFTEGRISKDKEFHNVTRCLNVTGTVSLAPTNFRCVPTSTFDQKLATSSILIALGYFESLVAFYSLLTLTSIVRRQMAANQQQNFGMQSREEAGVSNITVNDFFEERMRQEGQNGSQTGSNRRLPSQDGSAGFTMHISPSQGEFPDSKQFREHLENLDK